MNTEKCFIMGMPEAGKTTFIAALWYVLQDTNDSSLRIEKYTGDLSYLSGISKKWADIEQIPRTKPEFEEQSIVLSLVNSQNENITLAFPDLSGESFQHQYEKREAKKEHFKLIRDCSSVILFIHPDKIKEPCLISQVPAHVREDESEVEEVKKESKPRNPKEDDPTQVQLVELLQFLTYMRDDQLVRLCIIISAWDLVEAAKPGSKPEIFIKEKMPLLWQYVKSNTQIFNVAYYGMSAQGGKLEERDKLLKINNPCDRINIIDNDGNSSNDITLPISWVMSNNNE